MNLRYMMFKISKIFTGRKRALRSYLKTYLNPTIALVNKEFEQISKDDRDITSNQIWTMWLQDDVPEIIQLGLNSIKRLYPESVLITEKNLFNYVEIPDYIWQKYQKGIISPAHLSDYVRCQLLDKFGGIWIDASCYMLSEIPKFIIKQPFFIFQAPNRDSVSNFFIRSGKNNYLIKTMRIFLEEYWKKEDITIDYYFFHLAFMMFVTCDSFCRNVWKNIIPDINSRVRFFVNKMYLDFDEDLWDYLKTTSFMYKLNRKGVLGIKNKNSWYWYFVNLYQQEEKLTKDSHVKEET